MRATFLVLALLLAGCSDGQSKKAQDEAEYGLKATEDTGVIRGVVVDQAITPIEGARVAFLDMETSTDANGRFGFEGLDPGTYTLQVSKIGFHDVSTIAEVVAGVDAPDIIRVLLDGDPAAVPYVQDFQYSGTLAFGNDAVAAGVRVTGSVSIDVLGGSFDASWPTDGTLPEHVQVEMTWESQHLLADTMRLLTGQEDNPLADMTGTSPLLAASTGDGLATWNIGGDLIGGARSAAHQPVAGTGASVVVDQGFEMFVHIFYGVGPDEGWRFIEP